MIGVLLMGCTLVPDVQARRSQGWIRAETTNADGSRGSYWLNQDTPIEVVEAFSTPGDLDRCRAELEGTEACYMVVDSCLQFLVGPEPETTATMMVSPEQCERRAAPAWRAPPHAAD